MWPKHHSLNPIPAIRCSITLKGAALISIDQYRRTAGYVDRILRGEKPVDLPIQMPVKYQTVINMRTAKALGLDVPATLLARADEVID